MDVFKYPPIVRATRGYPQAQPMMEVTLMVDSIPQEPFRQCTLCQQWFPLTGEFWHRKGNGFATRCKSCRCAIYRGDLVPINPFAAPEGYRRCTMCHEVKLATREYFYGDSRALDGLQPTCKACWRVKDRRYLEAHKESVRQRQHQYYLIHRDHVLKQVRTYCQNNQLVIRQRNLERYYKNHEAAKARHRNWKKSNPHMVKISNQRREARKRGLPDTFTESEYHRMMAYWNRGCAVTGETNNLQIDHWIPLKSDICPGTVATNLIPLTGRLNMSKRDSDPKQWLIKVFGVEAADVIEQRIQQYFEWARRNAE
jgi:hypothetical protein